MTPERWQHIERLYHAALELAPGQRFAFLGRACGGDDELRREVESLLASYGQSDSFIESPPDDLIASLVVEEQARSMAGRRLGRYQILSLLGAGGMGEVYRARDTRLDRDVAVKILPEHLAEDADALRRFEREAKAVAALSHPNILAIHDFNVEQGVSYAVMELLEGETLREALKRGPLEWQKAVEIGSAIAEGLAAAHAKGIIHRDLKPENIFLTANGGVKILDFGIARVKHFVSADSETLTSPETTRPGAILGTIGYMSPEQARGEQADAPSDIFSFGCVLYEMVSGRRPFAYTTTAEIIAAILKEDPAPLKTSGHPLPDGLGRLIHRCLEKQPSARLQSARDLAQGLKAIADGHDTQQILPIRTRPRWRSAAVIAAAVAALLLSVLAWRSLAGRRRQAIDSLAVLPLSNTSKDSDAEYLSDGITESIINNLSQLPQLRVMARGTVFTYKGKQVDPRQVGRELGVRAVLTGRVVQQGDSLSVQVDLADAGNGSQLWGERYDRTLAELAIVEAEIARRVSEKLRLAVTGEEQQRLTKHHTENPEAHQLYLKGRYYTSKQTIDGFKKGVGYLNHAIELDPTYALAYAGLAGYYYEASGTYLQPQYAIPRARAAALQALKLDETLAEAHTALALVKAQYDWNWAEAEKDYKRAIELNPSYAPAYQYYGYCLAEQGRLDEAIAMMTRACELDPLTPWISTNLAWFYLLALRYEEAAAQNLRIIETNPDYANAHYNLGLVYAQKKMFEQAIAETENARRLDPDKFSTMAQLGHIYAISGKRAKAQQILNDLLEKRKAGYVNPIYVGIVYAGLGNNDQAFEWLERAYKERVEELLLLKVDPLFNSLRADPRFAGLLRRMNLAT